jgi:hypothetical protein
MIPNTPGWSWELRHDGIVTAPPEGKSVGFVRYVERRRPIHRMREVVKTLEQDPRFRITQVSRPERLITDEGEYGALVTVDGLLLEAPVQHTVACVFLDDFYSMIDGVALRPDQNARFADQVRNLALNDVHWAGALRRRRFYYVPPKGWGGVASLLHAFWFPVDYPANASRLSVLPAIPVPQGTPGFIDLIAKEELGMGPDFAIESMSQATPLVTKSRLGGSSWDGVGTASGGVRYRDVHVLEDGRFAYTVVLESPRERRDENLLFMRAVTESIESIPHIGQVVSQESEKNMGHWAE